MSSSGQRSNGGRSFRFFKIINDDSVRDKKLMLPKRLRRRLIRQGNNSNGGLLWNKPATVLVVQEGRRWEMELWNDEEQGCLWLRNGFHEFSLFYSLAHCHLLLFKHRRGFEFSVRVFDSSATEIEYRDDRGGYESLEMEYPSSQSDDEEEEEEEDDDEDDDEDDSDYEIEITPREFEQRRRTWCRKMKKKVVMKEAKKNRRNAAAAGPSYSNYNPVPGRTIDPSEAPSFKVTMTETYIVLGQVHVPMSFSERYMKECEKVGVKVLNGEKVWEMKVSRIGDPSAEKKNARITGGWRKFAKENNVESGNVCIFKLLNANDAVRRPLFHVSILKNPDAY
ncbi:B3 domain-containing transcription factor VRN1 [Linum perenne]